MIPRCALNCDLEFVVSYVLFCCWMPRKLYLNRTQNLYLWYILLRIHSGIFQNYSFFFRNTILCMINIPGNPIQVFIYLILFSIFYSFFSFSFNNNSKSFLQSSVIFKISTTKCENIKMRSHSNESINNLFQLLHILN